MSLLVGSVCVCEDSMTGFGFGVDLFDSVLSAIICSGVEASDWSADLAVGGAYLVYFLLSVADAAVFGSWVSSV